MIATLAAQWYGCVHRGVPGTLVLYHADTQLMDDRPGRRFCTAAVYLFIYFLLETCGYFYGIEKNHIIMGASYRVGRMPCICYAVIRVIISIHVQGEDQSALPAWLTTF